MMSPFKGAVTPKAKRAESSVKLSARFLFNDRMMSLIAGSNNLTSLRLWSTHSDNLMKPMIRFLWQSTNGHIIITSRLTLTQSAQLMFIKL
jgi:hypothetical protein